MNCLLTMYRSRIFLFGIVALTASVVYGSQAKNSLEGLSGVELIEGQPQGGPLKELIPPTHGSSQNRVSEDEDPGIERCPCINVLVSSLGNARDNHTESLGVFTYYMTFNDRPAYINGKNRLYFMRESGWLIGRSLGGHEASVANMDKVNYCPYLILESDWKYELESEWNVDSTLVVRCLANESVQLVN